MAQDARARRAAQRRLSKQIRSGNYQRQFARETRRAREVRTQYVERSNAPAPRSFNEVKNAVASRKRAAFSDTLHWNARSADRETQRNRGHASQADYESTLGMDAFELETLAQRAGTVAAMGLDWDDMSPEQRDDLRWAFLFYH